MGYDYSIDFSGVKCEACGHQEVSCLYDGYISYNHSWVFRKYLDKDSGFRQLYNIPLPEVIKKLDICLDRLREDYPSEYKDNWKTQEEYDEDDMMGNNLGMVVTMNGNKVRYDGWATTTGNAYLHLRELVLKCKELVLDGHGSATIYGD